MRMLIIDIDTTRPDHLGCYGYHRNTSPNIDALAQEGIRFDNYFTSDAPCLPSRACLMSGQHGIHSGVVGHGATAADMRLVGPSRDFRTRQGRWWLPGTLTRAGLRTASISPFADRHSAWWFWAGFMEMHDPGHHCGMESAEEIMPTVMDWLDRRATDDNWMLHVNLWDPHTPYRAPEEFGNPFKDEPLPQWLTEDVFREHRQHVGPHGAREINMFDARTYDRWPRHPGELKDMADLRKMIDGYDCGIRYADEQVGRIIAELRRQGVLDETIIIVTSDHGENQGELGIYGEHGTADQITCRIPMIIRWPGMKSGHVDRAFHYNLDLLPTLAEMLGVDPAEHWQGRSFAETLRSGTECGHEYLVLSQCAHVCQRSVRWDDWLYMRTYHDGYHLFPQEMLFNPAADPHEQRNMAEERPDLCRQGAWMLMQWHDRMMSTMPAPYNVDPLWTVMAEGGPMHARGFLPAYCERLKATGRGHAVEELKRRHSREFDPKNPFSRV